MSAKTGMRPQVTVLYIEMDNCQAHACIFFTKSDSNEVLSLLKARCYYTQASEDLGRLGKTWEDLGRFGIELAGKASFFRRGGVIGRAR